LACAFLFAILMQAMLRLARGWALSALQAILDLQLLGDFMRHAVRLPLGFFMQRKPGDLLQRMASNSELRSFLGTHIASSILDTFLLVGYAALMLMYQWQLGLLVIAVGCARAVLQIVLRNLNRMAMATELAALSGAGSTLVETLGAVETIRAASAESFAIRRWSDRVVQRAVASKPRLNLDNAAKQLTQLTNALGVAAVSALAGYQVITGGMSVGVFSAFMTLQALYLTPFNALIEAFGQWQQLGSHIARLDDVLETRPEDSGTADATSISGAISLRNVSFRYSSATPWILRDINIVIRAGEKIAIVGLSGSGKSTLARVMLGMLSPAEGAVYFDDKELRHYNLSKLRTRVGVVLQEIGTLNRSVTDNIRVTNPELSFASVKSAAQAACIDDVIEMLPNGFATILGDQGFQLSGGERQRLCIARAISSGPAVLVLDEATSALDSVVERRINANLAAMRCTRIVIAHRLDTIRDADRILVLDDGRIVQQGSFDSLSAQSGLFNTMLHSMYPSSGMSAGDCNSLQAQATIVTGCS
ncbi:MAG TPA: peptidase domain-containing ABC transporter, partial [Steroidobacteraceae bacterium]|nr:peptidase domain-containing ABC transporter [Steroidobacteraceae bacterium]